MYTNNAYLNNSMLDIKDKSKPLIVTSVGTYHLYTCPKLPTWRPKGRKDFQLLYIAAGKAHFHFNGKEEIVTAGHMVLYRPKEPQNMNTMVMTKQKHIGYTLLAEMLLIFFALMAFRIIRISSIVVLILNIKEYLEI